MPSFHVTSPVIGSHILVDDTWYKVETEVDWCGYFFATDSVGEDYLWHVDRVSGSSIVIKERKIVS